MERKFDSDIGTRISEGKGRRSASKVGVLSAVAISCALLLGSAAYLLPVMTSAEEGKVVSVDMVDAMDYLVYNENNVELIHYAEFKGDYDVKKSTNVKAMAYPPSLNAPGKYVKFTYTTTIHLDVLDNLNLDEPVVLGDLAIPYVSSALATGDVPLTWSMTVDGVTWQSGTQIFDGFGTSTGFYSAPAAANYANGVLSVNVNLPVLSDDAYIYVDDMLTALPTAYTAFDDVLIQVYVKANSPTDSDLGGMDIESYLTGIEAVEDAFPGFYDGLDVPDASVVADESRVPMEGTVKLDASASVRATSYEWYLDSAKLLEEDDAIITYEFASEMPGDYTFEVKVFSAAGLWDIAEVVVTVYDNVDPTAVINDLAPVTDPETGLTTVKFDGSDSEDNVDDELSYVWIITAPDGCRTWGYEETIEYTFLYDGTYTISLTVYDAAGNSGDDTMTYTIPVESDPSNDETIV